MRTFVSLLFLCTTMRADSPDTDKTEVKAKVEHSFSEEISETMAEFHQQLTGLNDEIKKKLTLNKTEQAKAKERLKQVKKTKVHGVQPESDSIEEINENAGVRELLFQGDIVLTKEQSNRILADISAGTRSKRQAYRDQYYPSTTWMNRTVSYFFDASATPSVRKVFEIAAKLWQRDTCLDIVEKENASDAIRVLDMGGCWSYIGKIGGIQNLSLGVRCNSTRAAAHELGHALGFFHTQSRHDRDNYITVIIENIRAEKLNEFTLETKEINDNYDLPYDYGSLMHYGSTSSTKNKEQNLLTMLPMDLNYIETLGSPFISFIDLLMMNKHYNCTEDCPAEKSAKCANNGFPHPRNCSMCICPGGYGGPLCNERPEGCGEILHAQSYPIEWVASIGNESATEELRVDFDMCYYWIMVS
ncbi:unnamed protein product [Nippostrongylus brasiliensis]|uniref:Zinc metalloproteinase n=1 Tax=Nippostrongylus brasiliensis TaxID=27835 RepID=A0A0N4Y7A4_NIPBR|nr:unnamed protein product [Nippostrongylus brasiliensis]